MTRQSIKAMAVLIVGALAALVPQAYSQNVGSTVNFGAYPYDADGTPMPIEWIVVEKDSDGTAVLLSKYGLDAKPYNADGSETTWANSSLRKWLNGAFLNTAFSAQERNLIYVTSLVNGDNRVYRTPGGSNTQDKVFLLSTDLVQKYFSSQKARVAAATPYAKKQGAYVYDGDGSCWWWLRSPGNTKKKASNIRRDGSGTAVGTNVDDSYGAVRAAIKVNLKQILSQNAVLANAGRDTSKPPRLSISNIDFEDARGRKAVLAGSKGFLKFTISNCGTCGPAFALKANVSAKNEEGFSQDLKFTKSYAINTLAPGESRQVSIPVEAGLDLEEGTVSFKIDFTEAKGYEPAPKVINVQAYKVDPPEIMLASIKVNDSPGELTDGNSNGIIEAGESVSVRMALVNSGAGMSKGTKVVFESSNPDVQFFEKGRNGNESVAYNVGSLQPGDDASVNVAFVVKARYNGPDTLPITMKITDERGRFNKNVPLDIALNSAYQRKEVVNVASNYSKGSAKPVAAYPAKASLGFKIPTAKAKNPNGFAVIIGVRDYKSNDVTPVKYALNDAEAVKEFAIRSLGYPEENVIFIPNPTKAEMEGTFGNASGVEGSLLYNHVYDDKGRNDAEVFVYYSGHGAPDQKSRSAYFVPTDAKPDTIRFSGYSMETMYNNLAKLPAKKITVVTDACFSGQSGDGKMIIKSASPLAITAKITSNSKLNIFNASRDSEMASWYDEEGHGLFTYYFLAGLSGEADMNKDGTITAGEMDEYLGENIPKMARRKFSREQHPVFSGKSEDAIAVYGGSSPAPARKGRRK